MKHKQKLTLARKLMNKEEIKKKNVGPFDSAVWTERKQAIRQRVLRGGEKKHE